MAGVSAGGYSYSESGVSSQSRISNQKQEGGGSWYFGRKEIEDKSPSRLDGIDLKKETYLRKSYCAFLQDLGMRLKVPQVTIATAVIFCHRFFTRQSHARNNNKTIATACMFLAGKVEETPRPLKDVILVSYEIMHKKDPATAQKIKQKEVYEQQKELILSGEKIVLSTLGFEFEVCHPYKPLVDAIKKFKVAQNTLAQVAWNFVNDGLRTSLCLQFKPHHIAAGAIFLAAKFLKVKLPSEGEKVWWQEFDITPRQLEDVSNQMLELYDQNCVPASKGNEVESSVGSAHYVGSRPISASATHQHSNSDYPGDSSKATQHRCNGSGEASSVITEQKEERNREVKDSQYTENRSAHKSTKLEVEAPGKDKTERRDAHLPDNGDKSRNVNTGDAPISQTPKDIKLLRDKVKAKLQAKRSQGEGSRKKDSTDEDDLIERELEDVELCGEDDKDEQKKNSNIDHMGAEKGEIMDGNNLVDDVSTTMSSQKRKSESPSEKQVGGKRGHSKSEKVEEGYKRSRREGTSQSHGEREPRSEKVEEGNKRSRREGSSHSHDDRKPRRHSQDRR